MRTGEGRSERTGARPRRARWLIGNLRIGTGEGPRLGPRGSGSGSRRWEEERRVGAALSAPCREPGSAQPHPPLLPAPL